MPTGTWGIIGSLWAPGTSLDAHGHQGHRWVLAGARGIAGCSQGLGHCQMPARSRGTFGCLRGLGVSLNACGNQEHCQMLSQGPGASLGVTGTRGIAVCSQCLRHC